MFLKEARCDSFYYFRRSHNTKVNPLGDQTRLFQLNLNQFCQIHRSGPYRCVEAIFKYPSGNKQHKKYKDFIRFVKSFLRVMMQAH